MPENDQTKWRGIRPVNPAENIPVTESTPLTSIEVEPTAGSADFPVKESAPLTSIKVSPLLAGTLFNTETQKRTPAAADLQAFHSFIRIQDTKLNVGAPNYNHDVYTVPAGYIFVQQFLDAFCAQATPTMCDFSLRYIVTDYIWLYTPYGGAWSHASSITPIMYNEGEKVRVKWTTTLAATDVYALLFGYLIKKY